MKKGYIYCTFQREGFHRYPEAADDPAIAYLAHTHRHLFHYKVTVEVDGDREIEFIKFSQFCQQRVLGGDLGTLSCESLAYALAQAVQAEYGEREVTVEVSEDGENGAVVWLARYG